MIYPSQNICALLSWFPIRLAFCNLSIVEFLKVHDKLHCLCFRVRLSLAFAPLLHYPDSRKQFSNRP
ncbi:hypothetical protein CW304_25930 [Bacillus sp. UFRGS-B20]|nr:hypothetical protein CW304_25930 [Bacillus sp. UFRGS-B20]